jgi:hypothetical protein
MNRFKMTATLATMTATMLTAWAQEPAPAVNGEPQAKPAELVKASEAPKTEAQQDSTAELAKKAQNPVADLMIMPFQYNVDFGIGPEDAVQQNLKFMPVIPFSLGEEWNLITRTIIPLIDAESPVKGGKDRFGLGDIQQSFFFTPKDTVGGWILGAGPIIQYPSATDHFLGSEKWGAGPSLIALQQMNGWTYGLLANHVQSFAGNEDRDEVSGTFLQPFLAKTFKTYTTLSLNTETIYDWENSQWTVPINASIGQMFKIGKLPISLELGYRYYAEAPDNGPEWGLRLFVKFLFPQ